jgi:4a-hydroxytetrahydrobiopterin dehydratase
MIRTPAGWTRDGDALVRSHKFPTFADAIAFVTRLAFHAEQENHHPDLAISYRTVTITWTTHDRGTVTAKDVAGARFVSRLLRG